MKNVVKYLLAKSGPIYRLYDCFYYQICFFIGVDSYSLGRKYISHFFSLFYGEIIRLIYAVLVVTIKNLEL